MIDSYKSIPFTAYILIVILLIIVLIYIYVKFDSRLISNYELIRNQKVNEMIQWLYQAVNDICYRCNMSPVYNIIETSHITYTDKVINSHTIRGTIYLVIWDEKHGRVFNHNTLIYAILHEITHILSPSIHHKPPFDSIETLLLNTAIDLGYYDPNMEIEPHYLTLDLA